MVVCGLRRIVDQFGLCESLLRLGGHGTRALPKAEILSPTTLALPLGR
jgi:hypothetical protein